MLYPTAPNDTFFLSQSSFRRARHFRSLPIRPWTMGRGGQKVAKIDSSLQHKQDANTPFVASFKNLSWSMLGNILHYNYSDPICLPRYSLNKINHRRRHLHHHHNLQAQFEVCC